jgi:nucleoside 2-deoxyribosyltransferase
MTQDATPQEAAAAEGMPEGTAMAAPHASAERSDAERPRVYLAGPDVFLPDAEAWSAQRKAICAHHGLAGVSPLDPLAAEPAAWAALPDWQRIALRNETHIAGAAAVIANLTPFRGPSADPGTVYEVGYARGRGLPIFGYANGVALFTRRSLDFAMAHGGAVAGPGGVWRDGEGLLIEQFRRVDNLMLDAGILASGGTLLLPAQEPADRWRDLATFECCVAAAAAALCDGGSGGSGDGGANARSGACAAGTPAPRAGSRSCAAPATARR